MAKKDTREKILGAAEVLFSEHGYNGVPTKQIAHAAGITEMTLYNHFRNKKTLYKTVVKERFLAIDVESAVADLIFGNLEENLNTLAGTLIENFLKNRNILMMRLKEKHQFDDERSFRIGQDPLLKQIGPLFKAYEDIGVIRENGDAAAEQFTASLKGLFYVSLLNDWSEEETGKSVRSFVNTFCHGVIIEERR